MKYQIFLYIIKIFLDLKNSLIKLNKANYLKLYCIFINTVIHIDMNWKKCTYIAHIYLLNILGSYRRYRIFNHFTHILYFLINCIHLLNSITMWNLLPIKSLQTIFWKYLLIFFIWKNTDLKINRWIFYNQNLVRNVKFLIR